jgi:hypothetical protein
MACKNCASLNEKRQFNSTGEVTKFMRRLRSLVEDGKITEFPSFTELDEVEDDASWPDIIEIQLGCPDCGTEFTFKANSHHGKPPQWIPKRGTSR